MCLNSYLCGMNSKLRARTVVVMNLLQDIYSPIWGAAIFAIALLVAHAWLQIFKQDALKVSLNDGRFGELDGLRGVLAFCVFITHAASTYSYRITGVWDWPHSVFYTMFGYLPVSLFFMITGFLFWNKAIRGKIYAKSLVVGRVFRIFPAYLVSMVPLLLCVGILSGWQVVEGPGLFLRHLAQWLVLGVAGRPPLNGVADTWVINPAIWTLRAEIVFYAILPLAAFLAAPRWFLVAAPVVLICALLVGGPAGGGVWIHFLFGMVAAHLYERQSSIPILKSGYMSALNVVLLAMIWLNRQNGYGAMYALEQFPIFLSVLYGNTFFGLLSSNPTRWIGEVSYSLYVLHGPLLFGMFWGICEFFPMSHMLPFEYWSFIAAVSVVLILISSINYKFVERPFIGIRSFSDIQRFVFLSRAS